jgi:anthranilate synthase component II
MIRSRTTSCSTSASWARSPWYGATISSNSRRLKPSSLTAGHSVEVIKQFGSEIPVLGVCLGHQSIGQAFGAKVVRAKHLMHGKTSSIAHDDTGVFAGLEPNFTATRYHSLVIEDLPAELVVNAWVDDPTGRTIMGVRHRDYPIHGVQFHPESALTEHGHKMLENFLKVCA